MTQADEQNSWDDNLFLVSIKSRSGSAMQFAAFMTTYNITPGVKGFNSAANGAGGRLKMHQSETDTEVVFEGFFTQVGNGEGVDGLINTDDATQPLSISHDHTRTEYVVSIMHTTNLAQTDAFAVTTDGDRAQRDTFYNAEFTQAAKVFTDGSRKTTLNMKVTPFNKAGTANITEESTDGESEDILPAILYT